METLKQLQSSLWTVAAIGTEDTQIIRRKLGPERQQLQEYDTFLIIIIQKC